MRADDLLAGPRGRRLCSELASDRVFVGVPNPPSLVRAAIDEVVERLGEPDAEAAILEALVRSVGAAQYWQDPDEVDWQLADPDVTALLAPLAEALADHPSTAWWCSPLDATTQVYASTDWSTPLRKFTGVAEALQAWRADAVKADDRMRRHRQELGEDLWAITGDEWWSPPIFAAPDTTRIHSSSGPVDLWLFEDYAGWNRARTWPVTGPAGARVAEIDGAEAWADLVRRHPLDVTFARGANWLQATGRDGPWALPDWPSVATEVDAVHLTVAGYLQASGRVVDLGDGWATFLAGWGPDATYWLTDLRVADDDPTWWQLSDDDELTWHRLPGEPSTIDVAS